MTNSQHGVKDRSAVVHWSAGDGIRLAGRMWPALGGTSYARGSHPAARRQQEDPTLICLPGLSRNTRDFNDIAAFLQVRGWRVVAFDYRGRGLSAWDDVPENYSMEREAEDIDAGLQQLEIGRFALLGTSRGGLHAMAMVARHQPGRISKVILNDIGPRIEPQSLVRICHSVGKQMAYESATDLAGRLRLDLGGQFTKLSNDDWTKLAHQLGERQEDGKFHLSYDPALAETLTDWGDPDNPPEWPDLWPLFSGMETIPLMVIRGENSDLLSKVTAEAMVARHENCTLVTVPDQGHAPLLWDLPTQEKISGFLAASPDS